MRAGCLFNADDAQDWAAGAKLHIRANAYLDRRGDLLSVNERAKARVAVGHETSAAAQAKLGVLARDHRPLLGRKEVVSLGRIAANAHNFTGERALAHKFAAAIFRKNDLHWNL